jgi:hypothetical protein
MGHTYITIIDEIEIVRIMQNKTEIKKNYSAFTSTKVEFEKKC